MNDHISGEDLAAYLDGRLSAQKKNGLESHFSSCPACLYELVETAGLMHGRDRIPARFLRQALGEKSAAGRPVLRLRLVFEVAAAVLVVVFIGYFFLRGNRFWPAPEGQKSSGVIEEKARPRNDGAAVSQGDASTTFRDAAAAPLKLAEHDRTDSLAADKKTNAAIDEDLPAASDGRMTAGKQKNALQKIVEETPQPALEKTNLPKKELARAAAEPQAVGAVQTDFAAKGQPAAKAMETITVEAEQNLEMFKETGAGAALPATPGKKLDAALMQKKIADKRSASPVRIEGDVDWPDLLNPELFSTWSWFQKKLVLELRINSAGIVTAVVASGKVDALVAKQGANEAKKLLFSVSEKKSRRARLVENEKPPNQAELDKSPR